MIMRQIIKTAFTLIELLVVIAIIGILSGLIVVTMNGVTDKANIAKAQVFNNSLRNALMLNLVSEWKLEGNANDSWGSNNGTLNGTTAVSSCVYGACRDFNGTNTDYISVGNPSSIVSLQSGAISLWFKSDDVSNEKPLFGVYNATYVILETRISKMKIDAGGNQATGSTTLKTGSWYNAVYSSDGTNWKLYLNGKQETLTIAGTDGVWFGDVSSGNCYIAAFTPSSLYFDGSLDEIRMYNAPVPTSEVRIMYYSGLNRLLADDKISQKEYIARLAD
jgi:prepilin-type N-terminal cleavage/methylation domain-containing protein